MIFVWILSGMIVRFFPIQLANVDVVCSVAIDPMIPPIPAGVGKLCPMFRNCVIAVRDRDIVMIVGMMVRILRVGFLKVLCW